jgi:Cu-processing system permease protein
VIRALVTLTVNGFREARRHRVSVVVAGFALVLLLGSTLVAEVTIYSMHRVLTDFGLGAMSISLVMLTIFLSCGLLAREIERRTIFLVVSKPVSRSTFLLGRFAGTVLTLGVLLLSMCAVFFAQSWLYGAPITAPKLIAAGTLWVELVLLTSVGFAMSSFSSPMVSAVVSTGLYFAGHLSEDIYKLAERSKLPPVTVLGKAVYYLLPNLERLNFRPQAAYDITPAASSVVTSVLYGFGYAAVLLSLAVIVFNRRDFK